MPDQKEEFIKILAAHKGIIFKVCNNYCQQKEDREDLVQEVIIQLWNNFDKYDDTYKITTWMYRIALNVSISFYRKALTRKKRDTNFTYNLVQYSEEPHTDKEAALQQLELFISQLDELNKALMILYLDGNSHEEIASILSISKSNVGTKINRIKHQLKEKFKKDSSWN